MPWVPFTQGAPSVSPPPDSPSMRGWKLGQVVAFVLLFPGVKKPLNYLFLEQLAVSTGQGQAEKSADANGRSWSPEHRLCLSSWKEPRRSLNPMVPSPSCTAEPSKQYGNIPVPKPHPGPLLEWSLGISIFQSSQLLPVCRQDREPLTHCFLMEKLRLRKRQGLAKVTWTHSGRTRT